MISRRKKGTQAVAMLLAFAVVQISLQLSFAAPTESTLPTLEPQGVVGRISINGSSPVTINGNNAVSGDSVPPGALVQTPDGTEATIDLGPLGSVKLEGGTRARVDYSCPADAMANPNPAACKVTVTIMGGCVVTEYKQGTRHEIFNEQQTRIASSDSDKERSGGGTIRTCHDGVPAAAAAVADGGLSTLAIVGIVAAAIAIPTVIVLATSGDDPSPSTP